MPAALMSEAALRQELVELRAALAITDPTEDAVPGLWRLPFALNFFCHVGAHRPPSHAIVPLR